MTQQHQVTILHQWQELHQIFYPCNKFDTTDKLCLLDPFYFSTKSAVSLKQREEKEKTDATSVLPIPKPTQKYKPEIYYPYRKNALFWCVYIHTQGIDAYYAIARQKLTTVELAEQIKIAEFLGSSSSIGSRIERPRITKKFIQELRSDLMVFSSSSTRRGGDDEAEDPLRFLVALSLYYDVKITVWLQPRLYFEIGPSDAANAEVVIVRDKRGNFGVMTANSTTTSNGEKKNHAVRMESWDRALRPATHYKVEDIVEMLETLEIAVPEACKKKADLYALLLQSCSK